MAPAEPPLGAVPAVASVRDVTLPLDALAQTPRQRTLDYQALDRLARRCMARSGATYNGDADARSRVATAFIKAARDMRFGLVDPARAARYGYHSPPGLPPAGTGTDSSPAARQCMKEADAILAEGAPSAGDTQLFNDLELHAQTLTEEDSRHRRMITEWRSCVARAGLSYDTPQAAADDPGWQGTGTPSAAELAAATTDVRCKREVDYLGLTVALRTAYERLLMAEHAALLDRMATYRADRARRALAALH